MKLHVFSWREALAFEPVEPTYAIRIFHTRDPDRSPLKESPLYVGEGVYSFDDVEEKSPWSKDMPISSEIADLVVAEFVAIQSEVKVVFAHCGKGVNRAPALIMGLNEGLDLGYDTRELMGRYPEYTRVVYAAVRDAAQRHLSK